MENCIFCKIAAKEIPCYQVYEDQFFLGFLDIKPLNQGQSLLIPKAHYRWVDDIPNFGAYFEAAKKIGLATKKALNPITICYVTLGFAVAHSHIRIIPRFENDGHGDGLNFKLIKEMTPEELKLAAEKIRTAIS